MSLFRKQPVQTAITGEIEILPISEQPRSDKLTQILGGVMLAAEAPNIENVIDQGKLVNFSDLYLDAWDDFDSILDRTSLKQTLSSFGEHGWVEAQDGSGRSFRNRKMNQEEQDALLLASVSARIAANNEIEGKDYPFILNFETEEYLHNGTEAQESLHVLTAVRSITRDLEAASKKIESSIDMMLFPIIDYLTNYDVDKFIAWVREISDDEQMQGVMKMIAQDIHDPNRGRILGIIQERVSAQDDSESQAGFADVLNHQDGEYEEEVKILDFAQKALSKDRLSIDYAQLLTSVDQSSWPNVLVESYKLYRLSRSKEVTDEIRSLTSSFYVKNHRRPTVNELRKLEHAMLNTPEEMDIELRTGRPIKKSRAKVSTDFITPTNEVEILKPKRAVIGRVSPTINQRERKIDVSEGSEEQHRTELITEFVHKYKLDANEAGIARSDVGKMLDALQVNATRNFGVTKLSEIKPFKDSKGQIHTIWRLNPAHYNGLSVSRSGKDTRIIYTISNGGSIGIVGIYSHDDYDSSVKNLR